jgi:poly(3-hydroxybutyrate) depolymerase
LQAAALSLADKLPTAKKKYLQADAGHYGIFNGSKWRDQIAPEFEKWMAKNGG